MIGSPFTELSRIREDDEMASHVGFPQLIYSHRRGILRCKIESRLVHGSRWSQAQATATSEWSFSYLSGKKNSSVKLRGKVRAFSPFRARRGGGSCPLPLRLRPQLTPSVRSGVSPQHRLRLAAEDSSPSLLSPSPASRRRKRVPFCSGSSQVLFFPSSPVSPAREPLLEASAADSTHDVSSLCSSCL
ncbi:hypothetical protein Taro_041936, partial [Colocasia esculenta]|nr:hypothetical protein [Colocasia esculenta]